MIDYLFWYHSVMSSIFPILRERTILDYLTPDFHLDLVLIPVLAFKVSPCDGVNEAVSNLPGSVLEASGHRLVWPQ